MRFLFFLFVFCFLLTKPLSLSFRLFGNILSCHFPFFFSFLFFSFLSFLFFSFLFFYFLFFFIFILITQCNLFPPTATSMLYQVPVGTYNMNVLCGYMPLNKPQLQWFMPAA
jgi:hypothetical protein